MMNSTETINAFYDGVSHGLRLVTQSLGAGTPTSMLEANEQNRWESLNALASLTQPPIGESYEP